MRQTLAPTPIKILYPCGWVVGLFVGWSFGLSDCLKREQCYTSMLLSEHLYLRKERRKSIVFAVKSSVKQSGNENNEGNNKGNKCQCPNQVIKKK